MRQTSVLIICAFTVLSALSATAPRARGNVITLRTGQVGGVPGACLNPDDSFRIYTPQPLCAQPILTTPFQPSDFDSACAGPPAVVADPAPYYWVPRLSCDLDARWIAESNDAPACTGTALSVLYCAAFNNDSGCEVADSVVVCWAVDDFLGDPGGFGPNNDGVYVNGVSLGPAFSAGSAGVPTTAVAYNVPLLLGTNRLEVYQADVFCGAAGILLNCQVFTGCNPVPAENRSWGGIKALYR